jgi:hypothetical protein
MAITRAQVVAALRDRALEPNAAHDEKFGRGPGRTPRPGAILLEERVMRSGGLGIVTVEIDQLVELWKHASGFTYAALTAENDIERDKDGAVVSTRPDAKGWKRYLDDWRDRGIIA